MRPVVGIGVGAEVMRLDLANDLRALGKQHQDLGELPCLGPLGKDTQCSQTPQIGPSHGKSRQFTCHLPDETERLVLEVSDRSAGVLMDRTREWGVEGGNGAAFLRR
jgi:hypothetical protein